VRSQIVNPESLGAPRGYSNGILAPAGGRLLFVAGQIAWGDGQRIVSDDFARQFGQALDNVITVVRAAGGQPEHVARFTVYVTDKQEYVAAAKAVGVEYRRVMGKHFPAMALVEVSGLLEPGAKVEIEGTAVIPGES
jgi:enamine deaminase RidA (YjgF/YER057c/UK114 family)